MADGSGEMDRRIRIETRVKTRNALGEEVTTGWQLLAERWAKVGFGSGAERREAAVEENSLAAIFITRWSAALAAIGADTSARIVHDGTVWDVKSVTEFGRRRRLSFAAVTRFDRADPAQQE